MRGATASVGVAMDLLDVVNEVGIGGGLCRSWNCELGGGFDADPDERSHYGRRFLLRNRTIASNIPIPAVIRAIVRISSREKPT